MATDENQADKPQATRLPNQSPTPLDEQDPGQPDGHSAQPSAASAPVEQRRSQREPIPLSLLWGEYKEPDKEQE